MENKIKTYYWMLVNVIALTVFLVQIVFWFNNPELTSIQLLMLKSNEFILMVILLLIAVAVRKNIYKKESL